MTPPPAHSKTTRRTTRLCGELPTHLAPLATGADAEFARGEWGKALAGYLDLLATDTDEPTPAAIDCRIAWCHHYLNQSDQAVAVAQRAIRHHPDDWHLSYLLARLARARRKPELALALLARLARQYPNQALIRRELAYSVYTELSDIPKARALWRPLLKQADMAASVCRHQLYSTFYEPDPADPDSRRHIDDYVARFLRPTSLTAAPLPVTVPANFRRLRVGLMSVFFHRSPVYPLTIGALRAWSDGVDLVFIDRGQLAEDEATRDYRSQAVEWHSLRGLPAAELEKQLRALRLDVLIDMSGWSDVDGLCALAGKPAPRQFKWIGGQAASTGLNCFDGFIGDDYQSPRFLQSLYTEPLINLPGGYASYSAPDYLPAAQASDSSNPVIGVISNPIKLSAGFLGHLRIAAGQLDTGALRVSLRFVGHRYRYPAVQERIRAQLGEHTRLDIDFVAPAGHEAYLRAVAELDWVVDTWPYTGGLTILEALAIGIPCRTRAGRLFCERHGYSHARYAGLDEAEIDLDRLGPFSPSAYRKTGASLLAANSPRRDHGRLARALDAVVAGHPPT